MITTYSAISRLDAYLRSLGIPILGVSQTGSTFTVQYDPSATQAQKDQGDSIASTWPNTDYRSKPLWHIYSDVNGLSATQKAAVTNDLFAGTPAKALQDEGANASGIYSVYYSTQTATLSVADKNTGKLYVIMFYVQDNPTYLINPPFDPSISVPGWEPVP